MTTIELPEEASLSIDAEGNRKRVLLVRETAAKWLESVSEAQYRLYIYGPVEKLPRLVRVLKGVKKGHAAIAKVVNIPDLIIEVGFDRVLITSKEGDKIKRMNVWLEKSGYETSGSYW